MLKKIFISILSFLVFLPGLALAGDPVEVNFFYSETCSVCAQEKIFIAELEKDFPGVAINRYNIVDEKTPEKLQAFYDEYGVPDSAWGLVPATFIGNKAYLGFDDKTKSAMIEEIRNIQNNVLGEEETSSEVIDQLNSLQNKKISLPFWGELSIISFSPLVLSAVVGFLDGFNVCALVALGILLAILVSTGMRRRVFIVGGTFILVSGLVYFVFVAAWLNVFLFLGYIKIITYAVGILVLIFAFFILKEYFDAIICKLCNVEGDRPDDLLTRMQKYLFTKANKAVSTEMPLIWTVITVALISAGINTIELVCSLGFPLAYTKILASHNLPAWQYYANISVYIFFYVLVALVIFLSALITMKMKKIPNASLKIIKLASGLVMLVLGLILLFKPELLTF